MILINYFRSGSEINSNRNSSGSHRQAFPKRRARQVPPNNYQFLYMVDSHQTEKMQQAIQKQQRLEMGNLEQCWMGNGNSYRISIGDRLTKGRLTAL
jgi:hypothetical protein